MHFHQRVYSILLFGVLTLNVQAIEPPAYVQKQDVVFGESHGTGLLMDVFEPTTKSNGLAIIDVASGSWYSDRGKIRDHTLAQVYSILCERGYVVFAVRPGSKTRYTALEMDQHLKLAIRHVKANADAYKIDGNKLGLTGASAGGHLATLAALTPEPSEPRANNKNARFDSTVAAVAVFFPPTDFVDWREGKMLDSKVLSPLLAVGTTSTNQGSLAGKSQAELQEMARAISPVHRVGKPALPFLLIHGDADQVVPLSHSQKLVKAIQDADGSAELIVKQGGGHPWLTLPIEVALMADWFDKKLK
ncbi:MAG: S9 family peptidase [Pirellula sp.]|nr:S9 family peptidase [Pirellula sp.]